MLFALCCRCSEAESLEVFSQELGDPTVALVRGIDPLVAEEVLSKEELGWETTVDTEQLARIMVDADIEMLKHEGRHWIDQPALSDWPKSGNNA